MSCPAVLASGPLWPQPVTRPKTSLGIAREADLGAEAEPLHHAGAKALDQRVGGADQLERGRDRLRLLQVERDRAPAAIEKAAALDRVERVALGRRLAVDADDVGAHVGEQHAGERRRADAGHFDDLEAGQRTHDSFPPIARRGATPTAESVERPRSPTPPDSTSCISCRCRTDTGRCGRRREAD